MSKFSHNLKEDEYVATVASSVSRLFSTFMFPICYE
jgi:hypothetical protein